MNLDTAIFSNLARSFAAALAVAAVAACGTPPGRAVPVAAETPSITYEYSDDEGLVDASFQAEKYCLQFNSWPAASHVEGVRGGIGHVTFICDQERSVRLAGARVPPLPPDPTASYAYRDDQSLIDAAFQAQRHCASLGAHTRSSTITTQGGTRTIVFECVP